MGKKFKTKEIVSAMETAHRRNCNGWDNTGRHVIIAAYERSLMMQLEIDESKGWVSRLFGGRRISAR